jgi:hypothetical protein
MRRLWIGCVLALSLAQPVSAQGARVWVFDDNPEAPSLEFGAPESDDILIAFACEPAEKRMLIVESVPTKTLQPGTKATIKLSAGSLSLDLTGDAVASETDGMVNVEVTGAPNPRLFALLKAGPALTIEVAGAAETISLAGATQHIPAFEKLCFGKK